ncbi:MAG TPA: DCC1-like thiol-disulfide oxidoreductase family protein [Gemmatimonadales bacterium]|nr:DCC1-like thiol-disulfide oxidoreductase family protein [Gemmatimonadales bacterium]
MKSLLRRADAYWFGPGSLTNLAIVRIVVVAMQLSLLLFPTMSIGYIGACSGCSIRYQDWLTHVSDRQFKPIPALKLLLLPFGWGVRPEPMFLHAVWLAAVVAGILGLIGLYTKPSLIVLAATCTLLVAHSYSYGEFHHPEAAFTIALWALAFGPSGAAWSVDELRFRIRHAVAGMRFTRLSAADRTSTFARWPLRLILWVLAIAYLSAGLAKVVNGGLAWVNGYTLSYALARDAIHRESGLGLWAAGQIGALRLLSLATIAFESLFWLVIIFPVLSWLFVLAGTAVHTGIFLTQRAPFPQLIVLYIVLIEPLRRYWPAALSPSPAKSDWTVIYDGLCPLCIRSMVLLDYVDVRRRLRFVDLETEWSAAAARAPGVTPGEARHAMHVVGPDGVVYHGFFAFRRLARALPFLWPLLPALYAPFAATVGPQVYRGISGRRGRAPCRAEACAA